MPSSSDFKLSAAFISVFGIALLWVPILSLHLTPALFAALLTYGGARATSSVLRRIWPTIRYAQGLGLTLFVLVVVLTVSLIVERASEATGAGGGYAAVLQQMAVSLDQLRLLLPPWLASHVPASLETLRAAAVEWLTSHASQVQLWGGHTVRGVGYAIAGVVIGALLTLQRTEKESSGGSRPPMSSAVSQQFQGLVASFTAVVFAQFRIAAVNTALTAVYLLGVLPLLGTPIPLAGTLVFATFIASLVPVLGNLISNTMIVVVSLTQSLGVAALSLGWLVGIHKLEYFLNAHIVGQRIRAQAWELLISMLVLEAIFGIAGLLSAPIIYAQLKSVWYSRGWI